LRAHLLFQLDPSRLPDRAGVAWLFMVAATGVRAHGSVFLALGGWAPSWWCAVPQGHSSRAPSCSPAERR